MQRDDDHLQEEKGNVDVLGLHKGLPSRFRLMHPFRPGKVNLCRVCHVHVVPRCSRDEMWYVCMLEIHNHRALEGGGGDPFTVVTRNQMALTP